MSLTVEQADKLLALLEGVHAETVLPRAEREALRAEIAAAQAALHQSSEQAAIEAAEAVVQSRLELIRQLAEQAAAKEEPLLLEVEP